MGDFRITVSLLSHRSRVRRAHRTIVSARPVPRRNPTHTPQVGLRCANPTYQRPILRMSLGMFVGGNLLGVRPSAIGRRGTRLCLEPGERLERFARLAFGRETGLRLGRGALLGGPTGLGLGSGLL